jgi:predicted phage terminase large subunit-like protein
MISSGYKRKYLPKQQVIQLAVQNPAMIVRELNDRSFYRFLKYFWQDYSQEPFKDNWHIKYLCDELQKIAENVGQRNPKLYDLIVNIPPGTTKSAIVSVMFPVWCWTRWYWMKFITWSYSSDLSLEFAEYSRDIIRSARFREIYPELEIKEDKSAKGNFRITKKIQASPGFRPRILSGGTRFSTSIDGTGTGFHGHILLWDDIINPKEAVSVAELKKANAFLDQTMPTRKVDKEVAVTIGIMQRLAEDDPTGHQQKKGKTNVKYIILPGELDGKYQDMVQPPELKAYYKDGLLDPTRLNRAVLKDLEADLGQYGYAGQVGQCPTPPQGGMFKVDHFIKIQTLPSAINFEEVCRYWDKAGTKEDVSGKSDACYTVGTKMIKLRNGKWIVADIKRGRWASEERERIILETAEADGRDCKVYYEQEPGSGGKESAEGTTRRLAGFTAHADLPHGDKIYRADPFSVQVNDGNVLLLEASWNESFIDEHRHFPFGKYKDQVDSASGAFSKLTVLRRAGVLKKQTA